MYAKFFIDPQGGHGNLGMYDYELLSRINDKEIYFFGNKTYNYIPLPKIHCRFWFKYNQYKSPIIKGLCYILTLLRILIAGIIIRPKVIHVQWIRIPFVDYIFYRFFKYILNSKLIYTVHNILPHSAGKNDYNNYKRMYELSDCLIVHTETAQNELVRDFKIDRQKTYVAPHGPLKYFNDQQSVERTVNFILKTYNLVGKKIFSMLGFQSDYKGTDLLIEAWRDSDFLTSQKDVVLIIAGSKAENFIKNGQVRNIIVIDGFISDIMFDSLLRISDIVLLPYRQIEQSGVLLTLISQSKPYCATNVGELTIPIKLENIGWIIPDISSKGIKDTLEAIIKNPEEIKNKSENKEGWARVKKMYDWDKAAEITKGVYNNL